MTYDQLLLTIQNFLLAAGFYGGFLVLFKNDLRTSTGRVICIMMVYCILSFAVGMILGITAIISFFNSIIYYSITFFCLKPDESRVCRFVVFIMFIDIFNFWGTAFMAIAYILANFDQGSVSWMVLNELSLGFRIFTFVLFIPAFVITLYIVRLLMRSMFGITGLLKWVLVLLFPVKTITFELIRDLTVNFVEYRNNPSGPIFYLDTLNILLAILALAIVVIHHIRSTRNDFKAVKLQEDIANEHYQSEVQSLKSSIRKMEHDEKGWQTRLGDRK